MTTVAPEYISSLAGMLYPQPSYAKPGKRCDCCCGHATTSPEDLLRQWTEATYQPWIALAKALQDPATAAAMGYPTTAPKPTHPGGYWTKWSAPYTDHSRKHGYHCGCGSCVKDDCYCYCCIVDADLVVHARLGERRVVPLTIENNRRRERSIRLELSTFTSKGGSPSGVTGQLLSPEEFTLAPCEQREITISIEAGLREDPRPQPQTGDKEADDRTERLPDVDDCLVAYADLRVVGCDHRPIRIAVTILPRDCDAYRVDCACGCC
jgi:hypothetical protein